MHYLIGTDEAGYGPNLGPLVVTATLWRVEDPLRECLYERLKKVVTAAPEGRNDRRLWLSDSKKVHGATDGLRRLELGVSAALRAGGIAWSSLRDLLTKIESTFDDARREPWHATEVSLPCACAAPEIDAAVEPLIAGLAEAGVALVAVRCRCIFPPEFNDGCERYGNKATLLTATTLRLVRELLDVAPDADVDVACDKHGGRNSYAAAIQEFIAAGLVQTLDESRAVSRYRFADGERRVEMGFRVGGESHLPTALASMVSKYVRETAMQAWNGYWGALVPNLRPTAGYPEDARRYRGEIAAVAAAQSLDERAWWRLR